MKPNEYGFRSSFRRLTVYGALLSAVPVAVYARDIEIKGTVTTVVGNVEYTPVKGVTILVWRGSRAAQKTKVTVKQLIFP